jgi:hypothetical protein
LLTKRTSNLLHALNVGSDSTDQGVDNLLGGLASDEILLSVQQIVGDLELLGVVDDSHQLLNLFVGEGTSSALDVNFGLLADDVGETSANTSDSGHGEHHLSLAFDVSVQHTKNVLKLGGHLETLQLLLQYHIITGPQISNRKQIAVATYFIQQTQNEWNVMPPAAVLFVRNCQGTDHNTHARRVLIEFDS